MVTFMRKLLPVIRTPIGIDLEGRIGPIHFRLAVLASLTSDTSSQDD